MELKKGYKQTEFGIIPEDWNYSLLEQNSKRGSGHTPSKNRSEYYEGNIVWVSLADSQYLDKGEIYESTITISKKGIENSSAILHPKGVVLMSRDAGIGKSAIAGCELCVSQHFITWYCNERKLYNWFLYYWLQYQKTEFERIANGSTIKTIGLPYFKLYKLLLPVLKEQTAIATALSDADALITNIEKILTKKNNIKQGAMQQLLQPKKGWVAKKLNEIIITKDKTSHQSSHGSKNGIYPFFTNSSNDFIEKYLNVFDFNDELIIANTGGVAFFKYFNGKFAAMSDCFVFGTNQNTKFIYFLFKLIEKKVNENGFTGSGIKHLDKKYLNNIEFILPNINEQTQIATILSDMDAEIAALETKLAKYQQLKQGMMQNLLTGKIRLV